MAETLGIDVGSYSIYSRVSHLAKNYQLIDLSNKWIIDYVIVDLVKGL